MEKEPLLSIIIPCYNEEKTLETCIGKVMELQSPDLDFEVIIVDDGSTDNSLALANALANRHRAIKVLTHSKNQGKGAALRTGFKAARGSIVTIQDADLEYNPLEIKDLIAPIVDGRADVVFGSRFMGGRPHRVLNFWHAALNSFLTKISNMFTDLKLTDMETCFKAFRREVIAGIDIVEDRFGFEPEITAKVAHKNLRIYEIGISYSGRTYAEGKKISWRDGLRALYCIVRYNAHSLPVPMQFAAYLFIGAIAGLSNLGFFMALIGMGADVGIAAPVAYGLAALVNYFLCIFTIFRHKAQWGNLGEAASYALVVLLTGFFDMAITKALVDADFYPATAKVYATFVCLVLNFLGRRYLVFREGR